MMSGVVTVVIRRAAIRPGRLEQLACRAANSVSQCVTSSAGRPFAVSTTSATNADEGNGHRAVLRCKRWLRTLLTRTRMTRTSPTPPSVGRGDGSVEPGRAGGISCHGPGGGNGSYAIRGVALDRWR